MDDAQHDAAGNPADTLAGRLSQYLDGDLDGEAQAAVAAHLAECAGCRATLEELRDVVSQAAALEDWGPGCDLWAGVAPRLERHSPVRPSLFRRAMAPRRFSFTLPQLAAAGLALMVLSGGLVWMARSGDPRADFQPLSADAPPAEIIRPANFADAHYDEAVADLEQSLKQGRTSLDPGTVRVLEDNLAAIDHAIDQCRRALAADPANVYLNGHLADAKQRKLALLRRASAFGSSGI